MTTPIRTRQTKIVATVGPASSTPEMLRKLFLAGVDAFRLNFSHGTHQDHGERVKAIRALEKETGRPICIIADMQGPKLRVGRFKEHKVQLTTGQKFRLDMDPALGDNTRVELPHPEVMSVLMPGHEVLLDDGKVRLRVTTRGENWLETEVVAGTHLSDHKGFNIPGVLLPLPPLTEKDRKDLVFALSQGVDWVALSFVQLPSDLEEPRRMIGDQAMLMVKVEKPSAVAHLEQIIAAADGVMVARGDLGVEMPLEEVPGIQKRMVRLARDAGKPIIVATQMLESMIQAPMPTRAEASDVATAVFDGTDAVMLSAETASGAYPIEAVEFMDRALRKVERDPLYRAVLHSTNPPGSRPDFLVTHAAVRVAEQINATALVTFTALGATALRASRERPSVPILCLTPTTRRGRQLVLSYGVNVFPAELGTFEEMSGTASEVAKRAGVASVGSFLVLTAGVPFGVPGSTNVMRVVTVQ